jgi:hypothetical protein
VTVLRSEALRQGFPRAETGRHPRTRSAIRGSTTARRPHPRSRRSLPAWVFYDGMSDDLPTARSMARSGCWRLRAAWRGE